MDYAHLLLSQFRNKPYEGRKLYLKYGKDKIGKEAFLPWTDTAARSAPEGKKIEYIYKELKAVIDSGIPRFIFWTPSGYPSEYRRTFKALEMYKNKHGLNYSAPKN